MELTGLPDTVMGTLKADLKSLKEGTKLARGELPVYIAKIVSMSDRDWLFARGSRIGRARSPGAAASRRPRAVPCSRAPNSTESGTTPNSIASEGGAEQHRIEGAAAERARVRLRLRGHVVSMLEPRADRSERRSRDERAIPSRRPNATGSNDRSSTAIEPRAAGDPRVTRLRASSGRCAPARRRHPKNDWLENAGRARPVVFLDDRPPRSRIDRRRDAGKRGAARIRSTGLDQANDTRAGDGVPRAANPRGAHQCPRRHLAPAAGAAAAGGGEPTPPQPSSCRVEAESADSADRRTAGARGRRASARSCTASSSGPRA